MSPDFPILPFVLRNLKIFAGSDIHSNFAHVEELYGIMYITSVCISAVNEQITAHHEGAHKGVTGVSAATSVAGVNYSLSV